MCVLVRYGLCASSKSLCIPCLLFIQTLANTHSLKHTNTHSKTHTPSAFILQEPTNTTNAQSDPFPLLTPLPPIPTNPTDSQPDPTQAPLPDALASDVQHSTATVEVTPLDPNDQSGTAKQPDQPATAKEPFYWEAPDQPKDPRSVCRSTLISSTVGSCCVLSLTCLPHVQCRSTTAWTACNQM